jgi:hypothetical protein
MKPIDDKTPPPPKSPQAKLFEGILKATPLLALVWAIVRDVWLK